MSDISVDPDEDVVHSDSPMMLAQAPESSVKDDRTCTAHNRIRFLKFFHALDLRNISNKINPFGLIISSTFTICSNLVSSLSTSHNTVHLCTTLLTRSPSRVRFNLSLLPSEQESRFYIHFNTSPGQLDDCNLKRRRCNRKGCLNASPSSARLYIQGYRESPFVPNQRYWGVRQTAS